MFIDDIISTLLPFSVPSLKDKYNFDTSCKLYELATKKNWSQQDECNIDFISKQVEISHCLSEGYKAISNNLPKTPIDLNWQLIALLILVKDFLQCIEKNSNFIIPLKRLNAIFKLMDYLHKNNLSIDLQLNSFIDKSANSFLKNLNFNTTKESDILSNSDACVIKQNDILPVTILFWEGPIARAYLAVLKKMGLKPERIIQLISKVDLVSRKPVASYLPQALRFLYAEIKQRRSIHYWAFNLIKNEKDLYQSIVEKVKTVLQFDQQLFNDAISLNDLRSYSPCVEKLFIENLKDEALYRYLSEMPQTKIIFTGGGIVPKKILELGNLKFIHVHPGFLPDIRGADCVLWSTLVKGRTSATSFYMAPGIDDGDIIHSCYLPDLYFDYDCTNKTCKTVYRAIYAFLDPWVRSYVLRRTVLLTDGFRSITATPQGSNSTTYHFMHEQIQKYVYSKLFKTI